MSENKTQAEQDEATCPDCGLVSEEYELHEVCPECENAAAEAAKEYDA